VNVVPLSGERRQKVRFKSEGRVCVYWQGQRVFARFVNLSTSGMCLTDVGLPFPRNAAIEMRIVLELPNGVHKIHWRKARVVWMMQGRVGVAMESVPQHSPSVYYTT
jgi:PilZ domain